MTTPDGISKFWQGLANLNFTILDPQSGKLKIFYFHFPKGEIQLFFWVRVSVE